MYPVVLLIVGIVVGVALTLGLGVTFMRTRMIRSLRAARSFEDTCAALERVVEETEGWNLPLGSWDAHAILQEKGLVPDNLKNLRFYFLCNAKHASRLLGAAPALSGMLPCSWAVYETSDGKVNVSGMNVGLVSRIFSGVPGQVMQTVARTDETMLAEVLGNG